MNLSLHSQYTRRRAKCFAAVFALIILSSNSVEAMELELPLTVNAAYSGDINAKITEPSEPQSNATVVQVQRQRLLELLQAFANQEQLTTWTLLSSEKNEWVDLAHLRDLGLDIEFDSGLLTLVSKVPRLGTQSLSMRGRRAPSPKDHFSQSRFASGLTVHARNSYNHSATRGQRKGVGDFSIDLVGFTTVGGFGGWSLFYQAEYDAAQEASTLSRKDVTLVHDDFKRGLRYAVGDVRPTTSRFQSSANMLGVNVERNYSEINPFRNLKPTGRSDFILERDSRVQFEVNGIILETQDLSAGTYSISDFPLAIGVNDVRVFVDDGGSRTEVANFSTYVDTTLLAQGTTNFGASVGVLRERSGGGKRRYSDELSALGFYEKGVSDKLTVAMQAEVSQKHALLATSAIVGFRVGVVAAEAAVSKRDGHDSGSAATLRYFYRGSTPSNWSVQTDLQASYRSDSFMSLADNAARPEETSLNARASLTKNGLSLSLAGEVRSVNNRDSNRVSATISKSFRHGYTASFGYQYLDTDLPEGDDSRVSLTVSKRLGDSSLRGQYKSHSEEYRAEWRRNVGRNVGDTRTRIEALSSNESQDAELDFGYIGNRYELDVKHATSQAEFAGGINTSRTNVTLAGSMGYADGRVAFGRPSTDGFIIVDRHKNLRGKRVFVTRSSNEGPKVTATKGLSTALMPLTNSYRSQRFLFSVNDLPIGYDLGSGDVNVYPGNLAGFRYRLGSDAANTVLGKLFSPDNEPISLVSGKLIPTGTTTGQEPVTIFTNRTGRFVAEKMRPGQYQIVFGDEDQWVGELTIDATDEPGLVKAGEIVLREARR